MYEYSYKRDGTGNVKDINKSIGKNTNKGSGISKKNTIKYTIINKDTLGDVILVNRQVQVIVNHV